jgi:protein TonB
LVVDAMTSGESFENPVLLGYPNPNYPRTARRQGWEGAAEIEVTVDESGKGIEVFLLRSSGHSELDKSALDALRQARFQPGTRNGIPETGTMTVTIRFRLE